MPWHSKEEFQHFKNTTLGSPVIMGRKTFESLGGPLKGRLNIVLTSNENLISKYKEIIVFPTLQYAYQYCREQRFEKIFVIGGGYIFKEAVGTVDEMIISRMKFNADGDVVFPPIDEKIWKVRNKEDRSEFVIYYYVKNTDHHDKD